MPGYVTSCCWAVEEDEEDEEEVEERPSLILDVLLAQPWMTRPWPSVTTVD
jgi:hypothetical protein